MLRAHRLEPVLPAVAVDVLRRHAGGREPVGPLPAELGAEAGALRLQALVERRDAQRPAGLVLLMGPGHGVVLAIGFERAGQHPAAVAVERPEAPDIHRPEIHGRLAGGDPFGERPAGAAGARDAEGVEAGADIEAGQLRRLAQDEVAVGGEGFRPVDEALDAGRLQGRHAGQRLGHQRLEMILVGVAAGRNGNPRGCRPSAQGIGFGS